MTNVNEIWLPINGYEGLYEISNHGRIKSLFRIDCRGHIINEIIKTPSISKSGYYVVTLSRERVKRTYKVHRLLANHFIPNPLNKPFINHIDSNPKNNNIINLEWCTPKENSEHCVRSGRKIGKRGSSSHCAILNEAQVLEIYKSDMPRKHLAVKYNVSYSTINNIKTHHRWKHITQKLPA